MVTLHGEYNGWVILLSFIIALFVSYSALNLVYKISQSQGKVRMGWMLAGAFVMGSGVWTMHFIGMMAFHIGIPIAYDVPITLLSITASICASYVAFYLTLAKEINRLKLLGGGFIMGAGIVAMHYTGMASMHSPTMSIQYNPFIVILSALIAVAASCAALYFFINFRDGSKAAWSKWAAASLMGLAVCGMHYTGMGAASFWCGEAAASSLTEDIPINLFLLISVTLVTLLIMLVTWTAIYLDRTVLERMAYSDPLTGLANRHAMNRYFDQKLDKARTYGLLFLDLDQFKIINDTLGHDIGDLLVQAVAKRLRSHVSEGAQAFRLGGDEFLLMTRGMEPYEVEQLANRILEDIRKPYLLEGNELYITGSIGISLSPQHGNERSSLLIAADTAMYQAKRRGKNQYCLYDEQMERELLRRMELEKDLRLALPREQLVVHYQPKWDAAVNRPIGVEALLRWNHPFLGQIPPEEFIPIAEETGLIVPITRWVLGQACRDCFEWNEGRAVPLSVSVNMSVSVFDSKNLEDMVISALLHSGLDANLLELEITETIVMHNVEDVIEQLKTIREMGVNISMDDFGAGYSSLGSIDLIPFQTLKIDKLYMQQSDSPSKRAIIQTIIILAKQLNLAVIAEGVETEQQMAFLQSAGCSMMQGYYFSKPMSRADLDLWLQQSMVVDRSQTSQSLFV
ncbi:bifunctional diguanylate cyclase/phosphodiesterase [Paenibacillus sp. BK720]|uniref:bifunctional diguanylate cyclase/phosphodiesterase n=1 Tax=Paenibacillus sp. BK720 TaxID=2587092 RepID=UPI00141EA772|nr:bifunctional diguanylate cyclase/phosphodiesterase [Paenibacillus sp. BK720]NIK69270.1 diguanylate cyclase (GGDEF)-like protein [Paenibacillus sp. BK720]